MSMSMGSPIRLRSSNSVSHFANLTPKHSGGLGGWKGILRILGFVGEIGLSFVFPEFTPLILTGGAIYQEAFDIDHYVNHKKSKRADIGFLGSTLVNFVPLGGAYKTLRASKNVIKLADETANEGFKYVIKGVDRKFETLFNSISKEGKGTTQFGKGIERISINKERALIAKKVIPPLYKRKRIDTFEEALQEQFNMTNNSAGLWTGYRKTRYKIDNGDHIFSNRDLSLIRAQVEAIASGKRTFSQARTYLGYNLNFEARKYIKTGFRDQMEGVVNKYLEYNRRMPREKKWYTWFGRKHGRLLTQAGQLTNPNDVAREVMNRGMGTILDGRFDFAGIKANIFGKRWADLGGLKGWARNIGKELEAKAPKITKMLHLPYKKRLIAKYEEFHKYIKEKGTFSMDNTFLMGWVITEYGKAYSDVMFYFNPKNTSAITRGSKNYGGKPPVRALVRTEQLKYLKTTPNPGRAYLKGENGFPPIALSPGGKRSIIFEMESEAMQLATLYIPLNSLRNVLSLISNAKGTVKDISKGVYRAKWYATFKNTITRLLPNKITRIFGQTLGNIISRDLGAHLSRLLKTTAQGFEKTKTTTHYANGHKWVSKKSTFSFNHFNWRPLIKQGVPLTAKSIGLRASAKGTGLRANINSRRQGKNIRRIPGIFR